MFIIAQIHTLSRAQTGSFMTTGAFDLVKSDIINPVSKVQAGVDVNYFVARTFSVSGGIEIWTDPRNNSSLALGVRWYPLEPVFLRFRGLVGENEFGAGAGVVRRMDRTWRLEAMIDYFINESEIALRLGVAYVISKY